MLKLNYSKPYPAHHAAIAVTTTDLISRSARRWRCAEETLPGHIP